MSPNPNPIPGDQVKVLLSNLHVNVRVGLHPWERHPDRPSRVLVSVEIFAAWPLPARADGKPAFIDYDRVRRGIAAWAERDHVDLLETLVQDAIDLCFADPQVQACRVSVVKPDVFNDVDAAGVELFRMRPAAG